VIPAVATAKISMRLVPDMKPQEVIRAYTAYVKKITPLGIKTMVRLLSSAPASVVSTENRFIEAAAAAGVREALGVSARLRAPVRFAVAALALGCALALPALSADVWAYAAYGALLAHGADPWSHAWISTDLARFSDPLLDAALRKWDGSLPRDVYGPLFTIPVAGLVVASRPLGPGATVFVLRALAALALLACIVLARRSAPRLAARCSPGYWMRCLVASRCA